MSSLLAGLAVGVVEEVATAPPAAAIGEGVSCEAFSVDFGFEGLEQNNGMTEYPNPNPEVTLSLPSGVGVGVTISSSIVVSGDDDAEVGLTSYGMNFHGKKVSDADWSPDRSVAFDDQVNGVVDTKTWSGNGSPPITYLTNNAAAPVSYTFEMWYSDVLQHGIKAVDATYHFTFHNSDGSCFPVAEVLQLDAMNGENPAIPQACSCYGTDGDPVNTSSGNFHDSWADLVVPGRGMGISWGRSYNSRAAGDHGLEVGGVYDYGPLGRGWTHPFNLYVDSTTWGAVVHQESGAEANFYNDGLVDIDGDLFMTYRAPDFVEATLVRNVDSTWTFDRGDGEDVFTFNSNGTLASHEDRNGYVTALTYDPAAAFELVSVTDEAGRDLAITWDDFGTSSKRRIETVADPAGRSVTYGYDSSARLSSVIDAAGETWAFGYDGGHRVATVRAPRFEASPKYVTNVYDSSGRVISQTDQLQQVTSFNYEVGATALGAAAGADRATLVTVPGGRKRLHEYGDNLLLRTVEGYTSWDQQATTFVRDDTSTPSSEASMGITRRIDDLGYEWEFHYDDAGNQISSQDPEGRQIEATFNAQNRPLTVTDGVLTTTTFGYDTRGNLTSTVTAAAAGPTRTVTFEYTDAAHPGDMKKMTDERGKVWLFAYNAQGMRTSVKNPLAQEATYFFDLVGRMTSSVTPIGNSGSSNPDNWRMTYGNYTAHGDPRLITNPEGEATTRVFDEHRNLVSETDAEQRVTTWVYDDLDRVVEVHRPGNSVVKTSYHPDGSLWKQTDAANRETVYGYTGAGQLKTVTDPAGRLTSYWYDDAGRLEERGTGSLCSIANGGCATYGYDDAGLVTSVNYKTDGTPDITAITYDGAGRKLTEESTAGTTTWDWDTLGRLESRTTPEGTVGYTYDGTSSLVKTVAYPGAGSVTYTYDSVGRRKTVTDLASGVTTATYDANSRMKWLDYPSNVNRDTVTFDRADRVASIAYSAGGSTLASVGYTRDDTGMVETSTPVGLPSDVASTYGYSSLSQLTSVTGAATPYAYDTADNLAQLTDGSTQGFDVAHELCFASPSGAAGTCAAPPGDASTFDYDNRGNRTGEFDAAGTKVAGYEYDQANRLVGASVPTPGDLNEGQYVPLDDARVLTTIAGVGTCNPAPCNRMTAGESMDVTVLGTGGVPTTGVEAVVFNVTYVNPAANGLAKINKDDVTFASAALVNFTAGQYANSMVVAIPDANGRVSVYTNQAVDVIFDITGYYTTPTGSGGSVFEAVTPKRLVDTRPGEAIGHCPVATCTALVANTAVQIDVAGEIGLPAAGIEAVALNVTAYAPSAAGTLKVNPEPTVGTMTLNYTTGASANLTTVATVAPDGTITVKSTKATDLLIDVVGYYTADADGEGAIFQPLEPTRAAKTATAEGTCVPAPCDRLTAGETVRFKVTGTAGVPADGVAAVVLGVTIETPSATGLAKVNYQLEAGSYAAAATLNYASGQTVNDVLIAQVDDEGYVSVYTQAAADVIIDVSGWYQPLLGTWTYTYGTGGLRASKSSPLGDIVTTYLWDTNTAVPLLLAETTNGATTRYVYGPLGGLLVQHNPDGSRWYAHGDQLGSTRLLTDQAGVQQGAFTYGPYGQITAHTGAASTSLGWAGQYRDTESDLVYLRARYYQPDTAQFLTRDPIEALTREPYAYVSGNPLNGVDPMGLCGPFGDGGGCPGGSVVPDAVSDTMHGAGETAVRCLLDPITCGENIEKALTPIVAFGATVALGYSIAAGCIGSGGLLCGALIVFAGPAVPAGFYATYLLAEGVWFGEGHDSVYHPLGGHHEESEESTCETGGSSW